MTFVRKIFSKRVKHIKISTPFVCLKIYCVDNMRENDTKIRFIKKLLYRVLHKF